jgi:hypothetical protein
MIWLVGAINKHIVHDVEGNWIGTFKDEEIAAEVVNAHNNGSLIPITTLVADDWTNNTKKWSNASEGDLFGNPNLTSEATDAKLAASNGWTNSTKGWSR